MAFRQIKKEVEVKCSLQFSD